ncbi:O-linked N-acetylglucosamine transferase, SPINDLY family protein [Phormidium sp. CCY1219]|uniref:O-linked N-acetylglucosamine transferase, SPINDLY family protein n=1 Tax=Phormidium sp. CCY1219 TaxID=2886104 RepID=UPI002D1F4DE2|nr:O-linked N-acetylglucosamine transferase, SPINDLY family protein [Phormidium sp. CCY1219]MEB3831393.1 O-linked N-acetylglucosamine transferase, SPINDLY family protein [Phormidium sp. CCY1219]
MQQQTHQFFIQGDYGKAAKFYQAAIKAEPEAMSHYWYLALALMLQGKEEAIASSLLQIVEADPQQPEVWTTQLTESLETEAKRQEAREDYSRAGLIREHIREIEQTHLITLLSLMQLALSQGRFTGEELTQWGVIRRLQQETPAPYINADELLQILENILQARPLHPSAIEFAQGCLPHLQHHRNFIGMMLSAALEMGHLLLKPAMAASLLELCRQVEPRNTEVLLNLAAFYQNGVDYTKGIELARSCYSLVETVPERIFANHLLLRGLMSAGGYWEEAREVLQHQESLLLALEEEDLRKVEPATVARLLSTDSFFPYFQDRGRENREIINHVSRQAQCYFYERAIEQVQRYDRGFRERKKSSTEVGSYRLKIGYISHCLRSHSVGWLARWLVQHHDRARFEIHAYLMFYRELGDPLQTWYVNQVERCHKLGADAGKIAEQIYEDGIDILIDLDSLTLCNTCNVMALKPAPVQVTWLGWDASGLPTIDYFIADPYVLPASVQDYYREKIWRLPHTYIAVDGFEVAVPTLRREELNIPSDAVVYYSGQRGYKRHPDTARLQMQIVKQVPKSYFLIKGFAEEESIIRFFRELAQSEGVESDRLRFLPMETEEAVHRANLGIADVVLDTYPYNGATTTLETLWMGIPLVTRVGEQFASRNSYTMMVNAGVTEGIAWTDEEYVEWGIRLGKDPKLRQQISWKLWQSRQTSPLWNAKQFTQEMEKAYLKMWHNSCR